MTLELYVFVFLIGSAVMCGLVMSCPWPLLKQQPKKGEKK